MQEARGITKHYNVNSNWVSLPCHRRAGEDGRTERVAQRFAIRALRTF
jgi:hypothetical protein